MLIAVYSGHSWKTGGQVFVGTPTVGKIEFYRIKPVETKTKEDGKRFKVERLEHEIEVRDTEDLATASFV